MKKSNCPMLLVLALFVSGLTAACQAGNENKSATVNQPAAQTATTPTPAATATANGAASDKASTGSLATPTEAYKTAYAARQKKDVQGLKRVLSKDIIGFFETIAEAEKKTVDDELKELAEKPQASTDETRNEKITGDTATLEYIDEKGQWKTMDFVKEGDGWKLTIPKPKPGEVEIEGGPKKPK
jgi:predicted lipid-binding transport protein (Tim44 family)